MSAEVIEDLVNEIYESKGLSLCWSPTEYKIIILDECSEAEEDAILVRELSYVAKRSWEQLVSKDNWKWYVR